jgi:hypothetical protein
MALSFPAFADKYAAYAGHMPVHEACESLEGDAIL